MHRDQTQDICARLNRDVVAVCARLGLDGQRDGRHLKPLNPTRDDTSPGSFVIDVSGATQGRWTEFAESGPGGRPLGGDVLDLIAYVAYGGATRDGRRQAFKWARSYYGLDNGPPPSQAARDEAGLARAREAKAAAKRADAEKREKAGRAAKWWIETKSSGAALQGSIGERYLARHRGVDFSALGKYPSAILCAPRLKHKSGQWFPGLLTAMIRWGEGRICAVHRTFLDPVTENKAAVDDARMMFGDPRGAAMRIWKGPYQAGRSLEKQFSETGELAPLMVHEGLEDALTWAMVRPGSVQWAMGTLGNLAALKWPNFADEITLVFDRDERPLEGLYGDALERAQNYNAARAQDREKARRALLDQANGRAVRTLRPRADKDSNDVWRGMA
ncbi:MAG: toprim domain-containing protein [Pseudomonadota bacterium]